MTSNILKDEKDKQTEAHFHFLVFTSFFFSFYFATSSSTTTTGHFALILRCICILNDSITWDPAEKITGGFHYFSPLGHQDPFRGSNNPLLFSIPLSLPLSPPVLLCSTPTVASFSW